MAPPFASTAHEPGGDAQVAARPQRRGRWSCQCGSSGRKTEPRRAPARRRAAGLVRARLPGAGRGPAGQGGLSSWTHRAFHGGFESGGRAVRMAGLIHRASGSGSDGERNVADEIMLPSGTMGYMREGCSSRSTTASTDPVRVPTRTSVSPPLESAHSPWPCRPARSVPLPHNYRTDEVLAPWPAPATPPHARLPSAAGRRSGTRATATEFFLFGAAADPKFAAAAEGAHPRSARLEMAGRVTCRCWLSRGCGQDGPDHALVPAARSAGRGGSVRRGTSIKRWYTRSRISAGDRWLRSRRGRSPVRRDDLGQRSGLALGLASSRPTVPRFSRPRSGR
jgi:hypothetical protein